MKTRMGFLSIALGAGLMLTCTQLAAAAQQRRMPDSPTGRMAQALVDFADADDSDKDAFLADLVVPGVRETLEPKLLEFREAVDAPAPRGAQKTGAYSAVVTLTAGEKNYEMGYEVEPEPPHRLSSFTFGEQDGSPSEGELPAVEAASGAAPEEVTGTYFERLAAQDRFSGSVLVARGDTVLFESAFGRADRSANRENTTGTLFDVGSITKMMTKIAIGQLARDGKLSLDDTLATHLPDYPNPDVAKRITIAQIVEHRSGLGELFTDAFMEADKTTLLSPRDFFPLFADDPLQFEPGTSQSYSNAGYVVLGAVIEEASGMDYVDYMNAHVFRPAGIEGEGFVMRDGSRDDVAVGYTSDDGSESLLPNLGMLPIRGCPAGSSAHTARGLYRLERALAKGDLLGSAWTRWFHDGIVPTAGKTVPLVEASFAVGGGGPGVNAVLASNDGLVFVILANLDPPVAEQAQRRLREIWQ